MRKALLPILLVFVGLGLVVTVFQGPLAMRVMKGGLERNVTVDPFASRAGGLHVVLCGAGGPLPDPTRGGPCIAVIAGEPLFLVDDGPVTLGQDGTGISLPAGSDRIDLR